MHPTNRTTRRVMTEIQRYARIATARRLYRYRGTAWAILRRREAIDTAARVVLESDLQIIYGSSFGW